MLDVLLQTLGVRRRVSIRDAEICVARLGKARVHDVKLVTSLLRRGRLGILERLLDMALQDDTVNTHTR